MAATSVRIKGAQGRTAVVTFDEFLSAARDYLQQGEAQEANLMYLLMEVEPLRLLWNRRCASWSDLLRKYRLSSPSRYNRFKVAAEIFAREDFEALGVSACILIAHTPKFVRNQVIKKAVAWWEDNQVPLTPQRVSQIVREIHPKSVPDRHRQGLQAWQRRAQQLEALLLVHDIEVPKFEEGAPPGNVLDVSSALVRAKVQLRGFYPSCSDEDLLRIATQHVETASVSLKHALDIGKRSKSAPAHLTDAEIDQAVKELLKKSRSVTASRVKKHLGNLNRNDHARIRRRLKVAEYLENVGRVGGQLVFRRRRKSR